MNKIIASFAAAIMLTLAVTSYTDAVQTDLESGIIRLHIIADSDSDEAQAVKLKVRDAVISEMGEKFKNSDIEMSRETVTQNLGEIERIADRVLCENGFTYKSRAEYGKFEFPKKSYGQITLPEGEYYGVRVVLGSGSGQNWWCVMYPPMCFTENADGAMSEDSGRQLRENLNGETYGIITGQGGGAEIKFKIVEIAHGIKNLICR